MKLDTGTIVLLIAAAFFYVRLVLINRAHAQQSRPSARPTNKKKGADKPSAGQMNQYWILSPYRRDWIIGGVGLLAMIIGILMYTDVIQLTQAADYWWVPLSAGILLFSFTFR